MSQWQNVRYVMTSTEHTKYGKYAMTPTNTPSYKKYESMTSKILYDIKSTSWRQKQAMISKIHYDAKKYTIMSKSTPSCQKYVTVSKDNVKSAS